MNAAEVIEAISKAQAMVSALCKPKGHREHRDWMMSIPAQPDRDPDLVIGAALREAKAFIQAEGSGE